MFRSHSILLALALFAATPFQALAARGVATAEVVAVHPTELADLVMLGSGFDAGLRQGMVCRVTRGGAEIAEVLLVDLRRTCSAALILHVAPRQTIRTGDIATIKVIKS